jgi:hypothetical protein
MTPTDLKDSAGRDRTPPPGLTDEARALWLVQAGRWEEAHAIAQDIHTPTGSWIHALLHLIEGDENNARYWFARAGQPPVAPAGVEAEWDRIAAAVLKWP